MVAATGSVASPVGYIMINTLDENEETRKTNHGGLFTTIDIATDINVVGDDEDRIKVIGIDRGLKPFDRYYKPMIKEFACEYNTGLITGYVFTRIAEKAPLVLWSGVGVDDIKNMINNFIGTEIQWNGVDIDESDELYIYYNQITDMLQIDEENVDDSLTCFYKYGNYEGETLLTLLASQDLSLFILDESYFDSEDVLL